MTLDQCPVRRCVHPRHLFLYCIVYALHLSPTLAICAPVFSTPNRNQNSINDQLNGLRTGMTLLRYLLLCHRRLVIYHRRPATCPRRPAFSPRQLKCVLHAIHLATYFVSCPVYGLQASAAAIRASSTLPSQVSAAHPRYPSFPRASSGFF